MNDRIAGTKGLGFAGVGIYYLSFGLARTPWYSFEFMWSTFGTVMSLATAITMLVAGVVCLLRLERLHGAFFVFLGALTLAGPAMMMNVWSSPDVLEGAQGSFIWNGWPLFGIALFLLLLGVSAFRGKEVSPSGSVAMLMVGMGFFINAVGHWGGQSLLGVLTPVDGAAGVVAAGAAFWAAGRAYIRDEHDVERR